MDSFYVFVMFIMDPILGYTAILLIILFISLGFFLHWLVGSSESVLFDEKRNLILLFIEIFVIQIHSICMQ